MASKQKRNPFSYFDGLKGYENDEDMSDSEDEDSEQKFNSADEKLSFISTSTETSDSGDAKLPSAEDVLKSSTKPAFLKVAKTPVDWEKYAKNDTIETDKEPVTYCPNNVPPPESYEPTTDPLKPSIGDPSEKGNCETESRKRESSDAISEESPKKAKT